MRGGIEPAARAEGAVQEQQRFIPKLTNIDRAKPPKRVRWRDDGQDVSRIEQAAEEQLITGAGKHDLHVALREAVAEFAVAGGSSRLDYSCKNNMNRLNINALNNQAHRSVNHPT